MMDPTERHGVCPTCGSVDRGMDLLRDAAGPYWVKRHLLPRADRCPDPFHTESRGLSGTADDRQAVSFSGDPDRKGSQSPASSPAESVSDPSEAASREAVSDEVIVRLPRQLAEDLVDDSMPLERHEAILHGLYDALIAALSDNPDREGE